MHGAPALVAALLYGSGLRLLEALQLRVRDLDFERREIIVRSGKGDRDRRTMLPEVLMGALWRQLEARRVGHEADRPRGAGRVALPIGLARKLPGASGEWAWQGVFGAVRSPMDRLVPPGPPGTLRSPLPPNRRPRLLPIPPARPA